MHFWFWIYFLVVSLFMVFVLQPKWATYYYRNTCKVVLPAPNFHSIFSVSWIFYFNYKYTGAVHNILFVSVLWNLILFLVFKWGINYNSFFIFSSDWKNSIHLLDRKGGRRGSMRLIFLCLICITYGTYVSWVEIDKCFWLTEMQRDYVYE